MQNSVGRFLAAVVVMLSMATGPALSQVAVRIERPRPSPTIDVQDVARAVPFAADALHRRELERDQIEPENTFGKTATIGGLPISGAIMVGQVIDYVLTYDPTGLTGPMTITDVLSGNQTYVAGSIKAPPGWSWTTPPYGPPTNTTVYSNAGVGPGNAVYANVPITGGSAASGASPGGGDGFAPMVIGPNVYAIYHHKPDGNGAGMINCWDKITLGPCSGGGYPRPIGVGLVTDATHSGLFTPTLNRTVVIGSKIYYPSSRYRLVGSAHETVLGIGCFDTASTGSVCSFVDLTAPPPTVAVKFPDGLAISSSMSGLVQDPGQPNRLLMYAAGRVWCVDVSTLANCWTSATFFTTASSISGTDWRDLMVEDTASPTRVFFFYDDGSNPRVACLVIATGANCPGGWPVGGATLGTQGNYRALSPRLDSAGLGIGVCVHGSSVVPECFDSTTGGSISPPAALIAGLGNVWVGGTIHLPGSGTDAARLLYARYTAGPYCFDFYTGATCTPALSWTSADGYRDYDYGADPEHPECLYGLGDAGRLWAFGSRGEARPGICGGERQGEVKVSIDAFFCSELPATATWDTVTIRNRPADLTGGTIEVYNSVGTLMATIPINPTGGNDTYALGLSVTGADNELTIKIKPTYSGSAATHEDIQLAFAFTADKDPQICYQTTVTDCGTAITNTAIFAPTVAATSGPRPAAPSSTTVTLNLGTAHTPYRIIRPTFASQ